MIPSSLGVLSAFCSRGYNSTALMFTDSVSDVNASVSYFEIPIYSLAYYHLIRPNLCYLSSGCILVGHRRQCVLCVERFCLPHWSEAPKRVDSFLQWSTRCGFCPPDLSRFDELLEDADSTLFHKVAADSRHVLHQLLPPLSSASQNYSLRHRTHQFSLPDHTGRLMDCNFLIRSLFKDVY